MYAVAVIGDIVGLIPFVNIITDLMTMTILWMMSDGRNKNIFSHRNMGGTLVTIVIEALPFVSMVPAWTIRVYLAKRDDAR